MKNSKFMLAILKCEVSLFLLTCVGRLKSLFISIKLKKKLVFSESFVNILKYQIDQLNKVIHYKYTN